MKREQFVTFLWRAAGKPEVNVGSPFKDVNNPNAYYYKAVIWAVNEGITNGTAKATFGVGVDCNRSQTVMFLYRYYEDKPVTAPAGIVLNVTDVLLADKLHDPIVLSGTVLPAHATNTTITYTSSNTDVVRVDSNGKLIPVGPGTAVITAKCGSAEAYCNVTYNKHDCGGYVHSALHYVKTHLKFPSTFKLITMNAGSYINSQGEECIITVIYYQAMNVLGNMVTDCMLTCVNLDTGKTIHDPAAYYDKEAERYWGPNRLHYLELSNEYLGLEIAYADFAAYYVDSYGIIHKR